jgi:hypothetical protein
VDSFPVVSETFILAQIVGLFEPWTRGRTSWRTHLPAPLTKVHTDVERFRLLDHTQYRPPMPAAWGARLQSAASRVMRWGLRHPGTVLESLNVLRHGREALNLSLLHRWFPAKRNDALVELYRRVRTQKSEA